MQPKTSAIIAAFVAVVIAFGSLLAEINKLVVLLTETRDQVQQLKVDTAKSVKELEERDAQIREYITTEQNKRSPYGDGWRFDHRQLKWRPLMRENQNSE